MSLNSKVLVADDNADVLSALRLLLKSEGYLVEAVASPQATLSAIAADTFDLVLMDLNYARDTTSGEEGRNLLSRIREQDDSVPVIGMTAWGSIELAVELMQHGLNDFVQKPWDNARLLVTLQQQIQLGKARRQAALMQTEEAERQSREWAAARQMQESLLPRNLPKLDQYQVSACWHPMQSVGGDFYEVAQISSTHFALAIGDVTGKGLSAALLMANMQALMKARESTAISPSQLCAEINNALCRTEAGKYVTFFYGILDIETHELSYTNAGHNPPLLIRGDRTFITLEEGGVMLGAFDSWGYRQGAVKINEGDYLVCYTDGVTEASNLAGEEYGEAELLSTLKLLALSGASPQNIQESIVSQVKEFAKGQLNDDLTLLVLTRE